MKVKQNAISWIIVKRRWYHSCFEYFSRRKAVIKLAELSVSAALWMDSRGKVFIIPVPDDNKISMTDAEVVVPKESNASRCGYSTKFGCK